MTRPSVVRFSTRCSYATSSGRRQRSTRQLSVAQTKPPGSDAAQQTSVVTRDDGDVEEIEVCDIAHNERATLRVGGVFLKIDADQTRTDVEVEAMAMAPSRPRRSCGGSRPCSRSPLFRGTPLCHLGGPSTASSAAGNVVRTLHAAPLAMARSDRPRIRVTARRRVRMARRRRRPSHRGGHAQPPARGE